MTDRRPIVMAGVIALAMWPASGLAYRTLADDPGLGTTAPVTWLGRDVAFELAADGLTAAQRLSFAEQASGAAATLSTQACSAARLEILSTSGSRAEPADGTNTIEWVATGWAQRGLPAGAAATTDVRLQRVAGTDRWSIVEADVYVNGSVAWDASPGGASLGPALVHELLHAIGLAHPCTLDGTEIAPLCSTNLDLYRTSILFPEHSDGAREMSADDLAGLCALYPVDECAGVVCGTGEVCSAGVCRPAEDVAACGADPGCRACLEDSVCPAERACIAGGCRPLLVLGDACEADGECATGLCADRRCAQPCASAVDCPDGFECASTRWCRPRLLSREPCNTADDCASALCLEPADDGAMCTNACRTDAQCLAGERCRDVGGRDVCAPLPRPACSVTPSRLRSSPISFAFLLVVAAFGRRRNRGG